MGLLPYSLKHTWLKDSYTFWVKTTAELGRWRNSQPLCERLTGGDEVALACLLLCDPREGDRLRTVAHILRLCHPSSILPPLHPVPHPTEELILACGYSTLLEFNPTPLCFLSWASRQGVKALALTLIIRFITLLWEVMGSCIPCAFIFINVCQCHSVHVNVHTQSVCSTVYEQ